MFRDTTRPYGAICWDDTAGVEDCITAVRAFGDLGDAMDFVSGAGEGQHWAVVDLRTMHIIAREPRCTASPTRVPVA